MRVVFSKLQNCVDFSDGDFRDGGSAFQHMGPETAKAREPVPYKNKVTTMKEHVAFNTIIIIIIYCTNLI